MRQILYVAVCFAVLAVSAGAQNPVRCSMKEGSQFDFWIGKWHVEWKTASGETERGTNTISKILGDCVIQEVFDGGGKTPLKGMSHSVYDARAKMWKQTWVDDTGSYLDFVGEFKDGKMTLWREFTNPQGKKVKQRMIFFNIAKDSLDWNWDSSTNDGRTWNTNWHITYKRQKS